MQFVIVNAFERKVLQHQNEIQNLKGSNAKSRSTFTSKKGKTGQRRTSLHIQGAVVLLKKFWYPFEIRRYFIVSSDFLQSLFHGIQTWMRRLAAPKRSSKGAVSSSSPGILRNPQESSPGIQTRMMRLAAPKRSRRGAVSSSSPGRLLSSFKNWDFLLLRA